MKLSPVEIELLTQLLKIDGMAVVEPIRSHDVLDELVRKGLLSAETDINSAVRYQLTESGRVEAELHGQDGRRKSP